MFDRLKNIINSIFYVKYCTECKDLISKIGCVKHKIKVNPDNLPYRRMNIDVIEPNIVIAISKLKSIVHIIETGDRYSEAIRPDMYRTITMGKWSESLTYHEFKVLWDSYLDSYLKLLKTDNKNSRKIKPYIIILESIVDSIIDNQMTELVK